MVDASRISPRTLGRVVMTAITIAAVVWITSLVLPADTTPPEMTDSEELSGMTLVALVTAPVALFGLLVMILLGRKRNREHRASESLRVHHLSSRGRLQMRLEEPEPPHTPEHW